MFKLKKYSKNPILSPNMKSWWEARAVLNPGATLDSDGNVLLLYRAMGGDRISRFGLILSSDGYNFKKRNDFPVFESDPSDTYERLGCEDSRITKIGDTYYITYTATSVHPATYPKEKFATAMLPWRVRVSLLSTKNFSQFTRHGVIIHGVDSKNAALFPEKINDQYAMLHRIHPDIWIAYSKDMINWYDHRIIASPGKDWDRVKIGAGNPPIRTEFGWLTFYHGVDKNFAYRLGIMLLDLQDPTKVIYRSKHAILEPDKYYEKQGFEITYGKNISNVVFTCGVVEKDNMFFIYYGASDTYICLATCKKEDLFNFLRKEVKHE
jgi:predicted GH43/DUF377 family glycosyl hydrolase